MTTADRVPARRPPILQEHHVGDLAWRIEAHDDLPAVEGRDRAADLRVLVLLNGERVREFSYPAYRIYTLLAHWTEGLPALLAEIGGTP